MKLIQAILLLSLSISLLTGCQTISIEQGSFLRPDKPITQRLLDSLERNQQLERINITTSDGVILGGSLITVPNAKFTLLYFGGNMFRSQTQGAGVVKDLSGFDNNLVILDHRGYGLSQGEPNIDNLSLDAVAIFDYLRTNPTTKDSPIIVHGLSLGSMIAGSLSAVRSIDGLVLEGSTTNVIDMVNIQIPWYATPLIELKLDKALAQVDNTQRLNQYSGPLLIMVGEKDKQTPPALSKALYQQAKSTNKSLLILSDKGHGNATTHEEFKQHYQSFINRILQSS